MSRKAALRWGVLMASLLSLAGIAVASDVNYTVDLAFNDTLGLNYLVDGAGMSLYLFTNDAMGNGSSTCYGDCASNWPPFFVQNVTAPSSINATDFGVVSREDGSQQSTFKGWPLYYYHLDTKPGDVFGQGVKGVWFLVEPATTESMA